jgi:hypothetical protein
LEDYRFHEGNLPSAYRYNFQQSLFNTEEYRVLQSSVGWSSFYILNERALLVEGAVHFHIINSVAKSIIQSPFGGIETSTEIGNKTLYHFIEFFCAQLKALKCSSIIIVNRPHLYDQARQELIETFLLNLGFTVSTAEPSSIITVTSEAFGEIIHARKKRKLNQSLAGFDFRLLHKDSLADVYNFIDEHRKQKQYVLSISFQHLLSSMDRLSEAYQLFGVFHEGKMVAASVAVRVSKNILYHFISDHVRKIGDARPALVLMQGIYNYCQQNEIKLLDLGTSAIEGQPNFKLIRFKTELGGQATQKLTFTKALT